MDEGKYRVIWRVKNFNGWMCDTELKQSYQEAENCAKSIYRMSDEVIKVAIEKTVTRTTIEFNLKK